MAPSALRRERPAGRARGGFGIAAVVVALVAASLVAGAPGRAAAPAGPAPTAAPGPNITALTAAPGATDVGVPTNLTATVTGGAPPLAYNWSGGPASCPSVDAATLPCTPATPGNYSVRLTVRDGVGRSTNATLLLPVAATPAVTVFAAAPNPVAAGAATTFSLNVSGGTLPFAVAYAGLPDGCAAASFAFTCVPATPGSYAVSVAVTDAVGVVGRGTMILAVLGNAPSVVAFAAQPASLPLGQSTELTVTAEGGVGTLHYLYTGLPPDCVSQDTAVLPCTPVAPGTYAVTVTVHDALNQSATAVTAVAVTGSVLPPPTPASLTISAFGVYPTSVGIGNLSVFAALVTGGTGPYVYTYAGLPAGCSPLPLPVVPCRPSAAGTFSVELLVVDASGEVATAATTLAVTGPPSPPSGAATGVSSATVAEYLGLGVGAAGVAVALAAFVVLRRRAR